LYVAAMIYWGFLFLLLIWANLTTNIGASALRIGSARHTNHGSAVRSVFHGLMKWVKVWSRPFSANEVAARMLDPAGGSTTGLLGYWDLGEAIGSTFEDKSGMV